MQRASIHAREQKSLHIGIMELSMLNLGGYEDNLLLKANKHIYMYPYIPLVELRRLEQTQ
jgi:hypothetical protein